MPSKLCLPYCRRPQATTLQQIYRNLPALNLSVVAWKYERGIFDIILYTVSNNTACHSAMRNCCTWRSGQVLIWQFWSYSNSSPRPLAPISSIRPLSYRLFLETTNFDKIRKTFSIIVENMLQKEKNDTMNFDQTSIY